MFYYIDQLRTHSLPIGFVKTKSDFIVGLVEAGLGKWTLVVAVISVDAYPFLAFPDLNCHIEDMEVCRTWKCVPRTISGGVYISKVPGCHLLR